MQAELTSAGVQLCFVCVGAKFVENLRVLSVSLALDVVVRFLSVYLFFLFFGTRPPRNYTLCNESFCLPTRAHEWRARGRNKERAKQMTAATA